MDQNCPQLADTVKTTLMFGMLYLSTHLTRGDIQSLTTWFLISFYILCQNNDVKYGTWSFTNFWGIPKVLTIVSNNSSESCSAPTPPLPHMERGIADLFYSNSQYTQWH